MSRLLLVALLATSCATSVDPRTDDARQILSVAASVIGTQRFHAVVAGDALPAFAARALPATEMAVVARGDVPQTAEYRLPAGYLEIDVLTIAGDSAYFEGTLGPIPPRERAVLDCGYGYLIWLARRGNGWAVVRTLVREC